jgi:hypothetical protein
LRFFLGRPFVGDAGPGGNHETLEPHPLLRALSLLSGLVLHDRRQGLIGSTGGTSS